LKGLRKERRRLMKKTARTDEEERQLEEVAQEAREAYSAKKRTIKKALRDGHQRKVAEAARDPQAVLKLANWLKKRGTRTAGFTPVLQHQGQRATTPEEKAEMLQRVFFPPPPEADTSDIVGATYPQPIIFPPIPLQETLATIRNLARAKAPGTDEIWNEILQDCSELLGGPITRLANACMETGYHPKIFRTSITVALRKPGKDDYGVPKAYRPVALLNTIGKAIEAIVAARLSYAAYEHGLLPRNHLGGLKGTSTETALHRLVDKIYRAWREGKKVSALLLDVSGAFDNVSHQRLEHELRCRKIDPRIVNWSMGFLSGRSTTLRLPGYSTQNRPIETGIPQGSPISPILYLFYNASLIERCTRGGTEAFGYIDDVGLFAVGDS
jgi:hypothetical protein